MLTLRSFLSSAFALLAEARVALGVDLLTAVDRVNESLGLAPPTADGAPPAKVPTAAENDRALAELRALMAGAG